MSRLAIFELDAPNPAAEPIPTLETTDAGLISAELAARGIGFERWQRNLAVALGKDVPWTRAMRMAATNLKWLCAYAEKLEK